MSCCRQLCPAFLGLEKRTSPLDGSKQAVGTSVPPECKLWISQNVYMEFTKLISTHHKDDVVDFSEYTRLYPGGEEGDK